MFMSSSTTSGSASSIRRRASAPLAAVTTWKPYSSRMSRIISTIAGSSSATSTCRDDDRPYALARRRTSVFVRPTAAVAGSHDPSQPPTSAGGIGRAMW